MQAGVTREAKRVELRERSAQQRRPLPVYLRAAQAARLRRLAEQRDMSQSSLVRVAIEDLLRDAGL